MRFWSEPLYGEWLIINSIPSYLSFSNIGFGSVAGNEMTMAVARDDRATALRVFQSCWWMITISLSITGIAAGSALILLPVNRLFHLYEISEPDTKWIIGYLGVSILLGQLEQLLQSAYRCIGRLPYGSFIKSCMSLSAFAAMLVPVLLGKGPRAVALWFAIANVFGTVLLAMLVRRDIPWIRYGWQHASFAEIRRLAVPAVAFMGFPVGNALNLQGTLLAVSYALGPVAVVAFSTARTMSRVALQMIQMVNFSFEPEFSKSYAQDDVALIRTLHRRACQMALILAAGVIAAIILGGPWVLNHWTHGKVPPSRGLLSTLLVVVAFYALWSTSSMVMYATNQHQRLAAVYLGGTIATVMLTFLLARPYGLYGAAASLLLSELVMNLYVLPATLRIAHDTLPAFAASMFTLPRAVHPGAILRLMIWWRPAQKAEAWSRESRKAATIKPGGDIAPWHPTCIFGLKERTQCVAFEKPKPVKLSP